jgi:hypothetical protein
VPNEYKDPEVQSALTRLMDAACMDERTTGNESFLMFVDQRGFSVCALSGKPVTLRAAEDIETMLEIIRPMKDANA